MKEYDVVKVIMENDHIPEAKVGDIGGIVMVHPNGMSFEVECVLHDGSTKWLGTFEQGQLSLIEDVNE